MGEGLSVLFQVGAAYDLLELDCTDYDVYLDDNIMLANA
jgi:hypothetical protein